MLYSTIESEEILPWTDDEIRQLCESHTTAEISHCPYIHADQYFIKWGMGVRIDEALAQQYVWKHTQKASFRVPKVYRYFEDRQSPLTLGFRCGYLVMEFIEGSDKSISSRSVQQALLDLWKIEIPPQSNIGPLGGSPPQGYLWADDGAPMSFTSIQSMNKFMDYCLQVRSKDNEKEIINLAASPMAICHGDIIRRNLRQTSDGTLYILDWGFAGVYPIILEYFALDYTFRCKGEKLFRNLPNYVQRHHPVIMKLHEVYSTLLRHNIPQRVIDDCKQG